jgi:FKBP-type peptidyl-prolyl cis-trans isomerase FkpA
MKLTLFTLLLICAIGFVSCRKSGTEPDIKQYDQQQILAYIAANGITNMQRDTVGGDTTGMYYKIISAGTGPLLNYTDSLAYVYTIRSFDGKFIAIDTVLNHFDGLLGHLVPNGLMLGVHDLLKQKDGQMRLLVPSHLGYGEKGFQQGSSTLTGNRLAGNQCLDYYVHTIGNQSVYDDLVIRNYITANNLTGYTKIATGPGTGMYYKIVTPGTGATINDNSSVVCNYQLRLMNNTYVDTTYQTTTTTTFSDMQLLTPGARAGLELVTAGARISLLVPSRLAYGKSGNGGTLASIPADACLRFEFYNLVVTNY